MKNPFPYSNDNKRYYTWNYYGKSSYGKKLYKVPIDANFTCPNRENGNTGCIFCAGGSNAFPELSDHTDLLKQYQDRKAIFERKWPDGLPMAYFQSYSNTYADMNTIKSVYEPFVEQSDIFGLVIATRSDCLDEEKISYFNEIAKSKPVWMELGLQSIHDQTLKEMNRGHDYASFLRAVKLLKDTNIHISVHLINGWPTETKEMMIETAKTVGQLPIHAVKFHMLHICKSTVLGKRYLEKPFELLSKEEYVDILCQQLTYLRPDIVIERLTGDSLADELLAPEWTIKKINVINDIDKKMAAENLYQGLNYKKEEYGGKQNDKNNII